ncbi:hypothetical protein [Mycolicibacterium pyrenivorans]|uniref:hypothetical protein n=1 Tax=Mycolicibacterium pyrenivorans TaxID=187102 RepID=UPI0021F2B33A|nr:hypothetical protein [Mycolicibacterium pyrenivorans]
MADPGRRFDDLFNFVCDPATLFVAFDRVAGNTGSRTPGVDGLTVADVEERVGIPGFLDDLRAQLRQGAFRPQPLRERKIPKPGMHFTATYSSWLNQVERWFGLLTDQKLRRGVHRSIQALEKDIRGWIAAWNANPRPFNWTKAADEIFERLASYLQRIPGSAH